MITVTTPQPVTYPPLTPATTAGSPAPGTATPAAVPTTPEVPTTPDGRINTYA
ncbi:hypothetical protein [Aquitalea sp. ASV11]|uniref:hypothetical protein n=1 Tax=Aquitalea sp. ASV11 TaxID=2795103 RepID=UPI0018ECCADA|nr:hypothetical protein [Aquitalea sp. ASV11]